ncbi:MAG TPA: hypothetical protein VKV19_05935 [Ktedonobacteraceae bacterium]|nr:hypothetical protein [Ktedonobacteraceae bacterium]
MDVRQRSMRLGALFIGLSLLVCLSLLLMPFLRAHAAAVSQHPSQSNKGTTQILPRPLTTSAAQRGSEAVPSVTAPAYTISLYENTTDATTMYNQGCSAAQGAPGLIVLDWGQPVDLGSGTYGTYDFGGADVSDTSILHAVANFALGVWDCRTSSTDLAIAIGESNYGSATSNWYADGQAWGNMVNSVQSYISNNGYSNVVGAYGAGDLETEWNSYSVTSSMVNGYNNTSSRLYFDFGDDTPGYWSDFQVWYVAWGAVDSMPLPEIYYTADATYDWEPLDVWACNNEGGTMDFKGTMSENASGTDSPSQSFNDMYNALGSNSCTAGGRSTMIFETQINYA